jgi:hypothetical protein
MPIPAAVLLAQLLAAAFACGINLYAVVALLGLASRLGWIDALPVGLRGLENGIVLASAATLYFVQFALDKIPYVDSFWDAVHTLIRPPAAAALAFLAVSGASLELRLVAAILAGLGALVAHLTKTGLRVMMNARPRPTATTVVSVVEDVAAITLMIAAITLPPVALLGVLALVLALPAVAPALWRAAFLGIRATAARLRGFFGHAGWRPAERLPAALRALVRPDEVGTAPTVVARAAIQGLRTAGRFRNGWLVLEPRSSAFVFRSLFRSRRFDFPPVTHVSVRNALLADIVDLHTGSETFTLFLLKDGPPADVALSRIGPNSS